MASDRRRSFTAINSRAARSPRRGWWLRREAFTIFELLVALSILVAALAVTWPVLDRIRMEYRLQQGAQLVQARMAGARVHAIDTGLDYQFRYEPGGQRFLILPSDQQALAQQTTGAAAGTRLPPRIAGRLPSTQTSFDPASAGGSVPQTISAEWLSGIHDADQFAGVSWSAPLLFHADGTATAAQVAVRDTKSRYVTISIRALTGSVSVSKIEKGGTR